MSMVLILRLLEIDQICHTCQNTQTGRYHIFISSWENHQELFRFNERDEKVWSSLIQCDFFLHVYEPKKENNGSTRCKLWGGLSWLDLPSLAWKWYLRLEADLVNLLTSPRQNKLISITVNLGTSLVKPSPPCLGSKSLSWILWFHYSRWRFSSLPGRRD